METHYTRHSIRGNVVLQMWTRAPTVIVAKTKLIIFLEFINSIITAAPCLGKVIAISKRVATTASTSTTARGFGAYGEDVA